MEQFVTNVKRLAESLQQTQQVDYQAVIDQLFNDVSGIDELPKLLDSGQLEECAIQLWNWAVTKRVGTAIDNTQKAKVRHVACSLLYRSAPDNPPESSVRKHILMASKTGRTWLDCKKPQLADPFLTLAVKSLEILYSQLTSRGDEGSDLNASKGEVERILLRVLSYQAESAISQGSQREAVVCLQRCKDMLARLPKETGYLSLMCYNFGVDSYNLKMFAESSYWLSQSYDIGKTDRKYCPGPEVQARVLRLLATVYLEWDCQQFQEKALNTVSLANKECMSASGLYLKIRILLRSEASDEAVTAGVNEHLESDAPLEVCLGTVKLLLSADRETLAFDYLKRVCQHFESSPELSAASVMHIELLLQRGKELLGKQKIEDIITGHYTGKPLTTQSLASLHLLLWDKAAKHFEAQNYLEALQWYNYSLSFYKAGQMEPNLAKLQRNRASCLLLLKQLDKAKEAIKEAQRCDPDSIFTQFSVYKIAVQERNIEKAVEALTAMGRLANSPVSSEDRLLVCENAASSLLSLAAQIALENEEQDTAVKALETLCENSSDEAHVLTALRCLVRLVLSTMETASDELRNVRLEVLLSYLKMALQKVSKCSTVPCEAAGQRIEDANWFRKIGECGGAGRNSPHSVQTEELTKALENIQICTEVWKTMRASGDFPNDPTNTLLLVYEFEARVKLNDPKVETVLESILELENVETKVLETIAALSMEPPAHFPSLCKKVLRIALSLYKKQPDVDMARCRQCVHSLIQLSLPSGVSEVEERVLEEVWDYYEEAVCIITAAPEDFPEMESLWLLTRAWNTGILLYSLAHYPEAEKWCGLGMSFLRHLGSLQESYQTQMSGLYSEVLDRLDQAKKTLVMEE
ncbi:hypothetical protein NHX12_011999 [Muraenolepis orangiensis]|uniref:Protein ZIP4 homolog n=1 Tax=Muraenolepis orangiensis TaxID=630683 RepID=A0A9Q0DIW9_9TELE|nr:hypothetical protein NHX12_011999 [Muraenolepis orangiensis]